MTRVNGDSSRRYEFASGVAEVVRDADVTRIVLAGDLDMSTVAGVRLIVERACESTPEKVVVDLSAVEFVDSHGLHLLAATHRALEADGCVLVVLPPSEPVRRAFEITGLDDLFGDNAVPADLRESAGLQPVSAGTEAPSAASTT
jgi:anti-sigma B factor antagonist